jgi:hypothetical protein
LAKAQAEFVNPEKSLTATIRTGRPGEGERSFRYSPLSSGLGIVRKTLGQHEIATLQTTAIDQTVGMVSLTTTLIDAGQAKGIDKSILAVGAPRRYRNREHLNYVAQQASPVRPQALRPSPPRFHPAPCAWPQGQR